MSKIVVVNVKDRAVGDYEVIYIGRGCYGRKQSALHNPFRLKCEADRDKCIGLYKQYLLKAVKEKGPVREEMKRLYRLVKSGRSIALMCFCAPKRCHGDVIKEFLELYAGR